MQISIYYLNYVALVGTPSGKSLYQIQAERILRLQFLASEFAGKSTYISYCVLANRDMTESASLPWYIMTSFATDAPTKEFFEKNNFFGLEKDQVVFFKQEEFPCITPEGKIILENKCKVHFFAPEQRDRYSFMKSDCHCT